jgi:hypothetical protein
VIGKEFFLFLLCQHFIREKTNLGSFLRLHTVPLAPNASANSTRVSRAMLLTMGLS